MDAINGAVHRHLSHTHEAATSTQQGPQPATAPTLTQNNTIYTMTDFQVNANGTTMQRTQAIRTAANTETTWNGHPMPYGRNGTRW